MTDTWIARLDPKNAPSWEVISSATRKTVVYGLSQKDAEDAADKRNKKHGKRLASKVVC